MLSLVFVACTAAPVGALRDPTPAPDATEELGTVIGYPWPPAAGDPPSFEVDEDAPASADAVLFGEAITPLDIELSDEARSALYRSPETDVPAVLRFGAHRFDVAVHLKGRTSFRSLDGKPSLVVDAGEFTPGGTFGGRRRFVLQNMIQDGSMLAEHVVYRLAREAGIPASRHGYVALTLDGRYRGLYGVIEAMDEEFVESRFALDQGNLYEGGWGADLWPGRDDNFELQEPGRDLVSPEDIRRLIEVTHAEPDVNVLLDDCFDADGTLATVALELVTGQADGYVRYANNYLLYAAPEPEGRCGARWTLLPWAPDQAFRVDDVLPSSAAGRLAQRCIDDSDCMERIREAVGRLEEAWTSANLPTYAAETRARIGEACERDPLRELRCASKQEQVLEWLRGRSEAIRNALGR
jgi:hypothetical protein